jgi:hypothetical protein
MLADPCAATQRRGYSAAATTVESLRRRPGRIRSVVRRLGEQSASHFAARYRAARNPKALERRAIPMGASQNTPASPRAYARSSRARPAIVPASPLSSGAAPRGWRVRGQFFPRHGRWLLCGPIKLRTQRYVGFARRRGSASGWLFVALHVLSRNERGGPIGLVVASLAWRNEEAGLPSARCFPKPLSSAATSLTR